MMSLFVRLCVLLAVSDAASLRHATTVKQPSADALASAMNLAAQLESKAHPTRSASATSSNPTTMNASQASHRAKLDVGFAGFNTQLLAKLDNELQNATQGQAWTKEMRKELVSNATEKLTLGLKNVFAPIKMSIGKTWMALPEDDQKNTLVAQLKQAFEPLFATSLQTFDSHFQIGLMHLKNMANMEASDLVNKTSSALTQSVLAEHCYAGLPAKRKANATQRANSSADLSSNFCIPSVVASLAHRLNDTQSLYSMSMRFQSGAMSLAQKAASKPSQHIRA